MASGARALPWAFSPGSAGSFDHDVVRLSNEKFNAFSKSVPNLNFDATELSEDFAEPCFHTKEFPMATNSKRASRTPKKGSQTSVKSRERELSRDISSNEIDKDVMRLSNKEFKALSKSAPDLNFDASELFEDFADEPWFHTQEFPMTSKRALRTTKKSSPTSVKVRASELSRNMSSNEREIKGLYNQWKQKNGTVSTPEDANLCLSPKTKHPHAASKGLLMSPQTYGSPLKLSPVKKNRAPREKDDDESTFVPSPYPDCDSPTTGGLSPTTFPSHQKQLHSSGNSPRRKKVAVKLKASDLNLSEDKKREIEEMFWKWKGDVMDVASSNVTIIFASSKDKRWIPEEDSAQKVSSRREKAPKAVIRQRSASLEPEPATKPRPNNLYRRLSSDKMALKDKRGGSVSSGSTQGSTSCSSAGSEDRGRSYEPRRSGSRRPTREDSKIRIVARGKSTSRSPSRGPSRSRGGRREERRRSLSIGTGRRPVGSEDSESREREEKQSGKDDDDDDNTYKKDDSDKSDDMDNVDVGDHGRLLKARSQSAPRRPRRAVSLRESSVSPCGNSERPSSSKQRSSSSARRRFTTRPTTDVNDCGTSNLLA